MYSTDSKRRKVKDWTSVHGARAEIIQYGQTIATGTIGDVTNDGAIVWVQDITGRRKLYERREYFEVWFPWRTSASTTRSAKPLPNWQVLENRAGRLSARSHYLTESTRLQGAR